MLKYKLYVFFSFLTLLCLISFGQAKTVKEPLYQKTIFLDAGHGGPDSGALYRNIYEKDINLSIVKKLEQALKKKGAQVFLTRDGDYDLSVPYTVNRKRSDLSRRSNMINRSQCDLYISIHLNADTSTTYHGAQVFYDSKVNQNKKIAEIIQSDLKQYLYTTRDAKQKNDMYLFHRLEKPGVLVEIGYISNPNDRYLLLQNEYQKKVANILTNSIIRYFYKK